MYIKRFLKWIGLKEILHFKGCSPPYVNQGDIWWASVGENVGSEINGKSDLFSCPVIVLKKLSHGFYFVIPTTTQKREGSWYVSFPQHGRIITACLHQARAVDYRRFYSKLSELYESDFIKIKEGFKNLYL